MAEEKVTPTPEDAAAAATQAEKPSPETTEDKPVSEIIDQAAPPEKKPELETVGLDKFLDVKKENKELKKTVKDLEAKIADGGASREEIAADIEALAEEFDVDKNFLSKLTKALEAKADAKAEEKLKPLKEKERAAQIDKAFSEHFTQALEKMPEYKGIVNAAVIKALSLDPKNRDKTFPQIIEEAYGNAVPSKRSIESTQPGGGKEPEPLDVDRARKDGAYFKEVMADPKLKAEYNAAMLKRGF